IVEDIVQQGVPAEPLWWTLIICCNLGGNGTPIGSISCVIAIYALKKEAGISVSWASFLKWGGTIMLVQVVCAVGYVMLLHQMDWLPPIP
ncbi:MAG: transporter, partial [Planctomycetota bacterium]